jgi:hypothetical protein
MGRTLRGVVLAFAIVAAASAAVAQSETVLFEEPGFPTADSGALSLTALQSGFAGAQVVNAQGLPAALKDPQTRLLVMPYGSAYPE